MTEQQQIEVLEFNHSNSIHFLSVGNGVDKYGKYYTGYLVERTDPDPSLTVPELFKKAAKDTEELAIVKVKTYNEEIHAELIKTLIKVYTK